MKFQIEIENQLVNDLATFQGKESLTVDEICALIRQTIVDKASEFVRLSADKKLAEAHEAITQASQVRQEEIANGITVNV